jgi:hypothetical protein
MSKNSSSQNSRLHVRRNRRESGSSFVELAAMSSVMVVVALLSVNICVVLFGAWINDAACRDATRAAAQRIVRADAIAAALAAARTYATASGLLSRPEVLVDGANFQFETFRDAQGNPQPGKVPFVRVTTRMNVKLPAPVVFYGGKFTGDLTFNQSYIYPLFNLELSAGNDQDVASADDPDVSDPEGDSEDEEVAGAEGNDSVNGSDADDVVAAADEPVETGDAGQFDS